jgi:hypothetical protein
MQTATIPYAKIQIVLCFAAGISFLGGAATSADVRFALAGAILSFFAAFMLSRDLAE